MISNKLKSKLYSCLAPEQPSHFRQFGDSQPCRNGSELIHIDRGAKVLGVGHLDWVLHSPPKFENNRVYCPQLDDRLGVWCLLHLLPSMGIKFDVLLTDDEERGQSTASFFDCEPDRYNWVFEFDRRGTDVVGYEYDTPEFRAMVEPHFATIGRGSFSDVCELDHLGVIGMNIGVGYHHEHTQRCFADLPDTYAQCHKFVAMFDKWKDVRVDWEPPKFSKSSWRSSGTMWPDNPRDDYVWDRYLDDDDDGRPMGSDPYQEDYPHWLDDDKPQLLQLDNMTDFQVGDEVLIRSVGNTGEVVHVDKRSRLVHVAFDGSYATHEFEADELLWVMPDSK